MKKFLPLISIVFMCSSCFIFQKKEKYGCPVSAKNTGAESAPSGKEKKKDRYKGGDKFAY